MVIVIGVGFADGSAWAFRLALGRHSDWRLPAHRHELKPFQMAFYARAPFGAAPSADVLKRWPDGLVEFCGMTEGSGTCMLSAREHSHKLHTTGRPVARRDIRLIDEARNEVPPCDAEQYDPVANLVRRPGSDLGQTAWHAPCHARGGKTQRLAAVHRIDEQPRSAIGKMLQRDLHERHVAGKTHAAGTAGLPPAPRR